MRRQEVFLDRPRRTPADQVQLAAGLVVGSRGSSAAEGLQPDAGGGCLIVDIEVPRRVSEDVFGSVDRVAVGCEYRARQRVGRGIVADIQRLRELIVVIDIDGEDGAEYLLLH